MTIELHQVSAKIEARLKDEINPFELDFMKRVYASDIQVYRNRLHAVGMLNQGRILDAGCGFGQWMLAMSNGDNTVHGIDVSAACVKATRLALEIADIPHAKVFEGDFDNIDAPNSFYDAIFAYSSMFFSTWRQSFAEIARILKPGGKFYFSANELGFYIMLWMDERNKVEGYYNPKAQAAKALDNTLYYDEHGEFKYEGFAHVIIEKKQATAHLNQLGFTVSHIQDEGTISLHPDDVTPKSFFKGNYYGLPGCYEVLAIKS